MRRRRARRPPLGMDIHNSIHRLRNRRMSKEEPPDEQPPTQQQDPWCVVRPTLTPAIEFADSATTDDDDDHVSTGLTPEAMRMHLCDDMPFRPLLMAAAAGGLEDGEPSGAGRLLAGVLGGSLDGSLNSFKLDLGTKRRKRALEQVGAAGGEGGSAMELGSTEPLAPGALDARRTLSKSPVSCVAVVGGAHGNESNGIALARHFEAHPELASRPSFETVVVIGNPAAVAANRRYIETDLNRCFLAETLSDPAHQHSLEHCRARELDEILGPKRSSEPRADFVIDLHNSTAATGVALMLAPNDEFAHEVAHYLTLLDPSVVVVEWTQGKADYGLLPTVGRSGMTFEVGPCPWVSARPQDALRIARLLRKGVVTDIE